MAKSCFAELLPLSTSVPLTLLNENMHLASIYKSSFFQGRVWVSRRDAAGVGHLRRGVPARADRARGGGAVRAVRRPPRRLGRLRLHGQGLEPRAGGVHTHARR